MDPPRLIKPHPRGNDSFGAALRQTFDLRHREIPCPIVQLLERLERRAPHRPRKPVGG